MSLMIPYFTLSRQYQSIKKEIQDAINQVLDGGYFILGKQVETFEKNFAKYIGVKYAIGVGNGTEAITLAMIAAGIKPGDEVIAPSFTASPSILALSHIGAKPVFVDIDSESYCIDPSLIEKSVTDKTKAILPVHLYGHPADMGSIMEIAEKHGIKVIEDAAQAHGAEYNGQKIGSFGDMACFSFYPTKNLGAFGDGGMLVTDNDEYAETLRMLRHLGQKEEVYHSLIIGYNSRLDELQAAILAVKLNYLDKWNEERRKNAELYNKLLGDVVVTPIEKKYAKHIYHLYVIRTNKRNELMDFLAKNGVGTKIHYPYSVHRQKAYSDFKPLTDLSISEKYTDEIVSLPMFPELREEEIEKVSELIKKFFS